MTSIVLDMASLVFVSGIKKLLLTNWFFDFIKVFLQNSFLFIDFWFYMLYFMSHFIVGEINGSTQKSMYCFQFLIFCWHLGSSMKLPTIVDNFVNFILSDKSKGYYLQYVK